MLKGWAGQLMDDHTAANVGDVKLLGVVQKPCLLGLWEFEDHLGELVEQFFSFSLAKDFRDLRRWSSLSR